MRYIFIITLYILCWSCQNNEQVNHEEIIIETIQDTVEVQINRAPEIPVLPFFKIDIEDKSFESFYLNLVEACRNKDTSQVLASIHDTLRFSKYECAYGQFIPNNKSCAGCARCTKKGMLQGVFAGSTAEGICERLFDLITKFGIGDYSVNEYYYKYMPIPNSYSNFHFTKDTLYESYFNYEMILPLKNGVEMKVETSTISSTMGTLPFQPIPFSNEVGMGEFNETEESRWYELEGEGYINASEVLTGFDYTLVIFEKTNNGWKITGFIQPPGC